jgi:hypothetical protein
MLQPSRIKLQLWRHTSDLQSRQPTICWLGARVANFKRALWGLGVACGNERRAFDQTLVKHERGSAGGITQTSLRLLCLCFMETSRNCLSGFALSGFLNSKRFIWRQNPHLTGDLPCPAQDLNPLARRGYCALWCGLAWVRWKTLNPLSLSSTITFPHHFCFNNEIWPINYWSKRALFQLHTECSVEWQINHELGCEMKRS